MSMLRQCDLRRSLIIAHGIANGVAVVSGFKQALDAGTVKWESKSLSSDAYAKKVYRNMVRLGR